MAVFDPKQVSVVLNGVQISDWADGADVISYTPISERATRTAGADGRGVIVLNPDNGHTLVLKIKQNSADNERLQEMCDKQSANIKSFGLLSLDIRDLLNDDLATGESGVFSNISGFVRGVGHNACEWTILFDVGTIKRTKGVFN